MAVQMRSWLKRAPVPSRVTCDGKVVPIGEGRSKWADLETTIVSLGTRKLVALAADGTVLRATDLDGTEEVAPEEEEASAKPRDQLVQLGELIRQSYRDGAEQTRAAYEGGLGQLVTVVSLLCNRMTSVETAWQQTLVRQADLLEQLGEARAQAVADGEDGAAEKALGEILAGAVGKASKSSNGKPSNGKPANGASNGAKEKTS